MSDEVTPDEGGVPAAEDSGQEQGKGQEATPPNHEAEVKRWKSIALRHEAKAKEHADAAEKLKDLEMAGKSETEKLQALLSEQQAKARSATVEALKLRVAAEKGLPPKLAKFLPDVDQEVDMIDAAEELLEASGTPKGDSRNPTRQPKSTLTNPLGDDPGAQREALVNSMLGRAAT